jgi:HPt (histidine-containing phosphotransfer) domain-containing protein
MDPELDLIRLEELRDLMQADLPQLVTQLADRISEVLIELDSALSRDDLPAVAAAAHSARNDALVLGAKRLLKALEAVELNARDQNSPAAREAQARVQAIWPDVRAAARRAAGS